MVNENSPNKVFSFHSDIINFKSVDGEKGKEYYIEGHVTSGDLDLVNDIVTKSCMDDMTSQFGERTIKLDFEHEAFRGKDDFESQLNKTKVPLGKAVNTIRDEKGVKVKWKCNPTWKKFDEKGNVTMTFKDLWENVEEGYYDAFSIAYVPISTAQQNVKGVDARLLDKVNLFNVALTGNAINPNATMTNVMAKSLEYMKARGEGQGVGGSRQGDGGADSCVCPECGYTTTHKKGTPCNDMKCPKCKVPLTGKTKTKEGEKKMVNEKDDPTEPDSAKPDESGKPAEPTEPAKESVEPAKPDEGGEGEGDDAGKEAEQKALKIDKDLVEIKSQLKELKDKNAELEKEVKEYKDIIEKARPKGMGAENAAEKNPGAEVKSVGPVDYIA